MKLAEALVLRRDTENKLYQVKSNLTGNAFIQEGDDISFDNQSLLEEFRQVSEDLSKLTVAINSRNNQTFIESVQLTMMEALEKREEYRREHSLYTQLFNSISDLSRYSHNEIRVIRTFEPADLTKKIDSVAKKIRELDVAIQQTNWLTDL